MIFLTRAGLSRQITSLLAVLLIVAALALAAGLTLAGVSQAAPSAARTSVDGIWGLAPTSYALTGDQTLTPTVSLYQLAPLTVLTLTLSITDARTGDFVFFTSTVATTTTFVDTGATAGGSTRALSTDDVIGFIFSNGKWVEAFFSDNS